jgi:hypothetical protein
MGVAMKATGVALQAMGVASKAIGMNAKATRVVVDVSVRAWLARAGWAEVV